jgi:hypothetical protein
MPSNALNDAILNAAILHVVKIGAHTAPSAPTGPFSEYAPQAVGIKRLPAYTYQPSGFVFCGGSCPGNLPGKGRSSELL